MGGIRQSAGSNNFLSPLATVMPELPEVEMTARLLERQLKGSVVEESRVRGVSTLKSFDPPIGALAGKKVKGVRRRAST